MPDLEPQIAEWRRQMLDAGIPADAAAELESHLREDLAQQMQSGLDTQTAFAVAVGRIGQAVALKNEFAKNGRDKSAFLRLLKSFLFRTGEIPFPPLADFTPSARQVLELAPAEARGFHHNFTGTEHVLLAITQSPSGIVSSVMQSLGLSSGAIRAEIEEAVHAGPNDPLPVTTPFTLRARKALQLAAREARLLRQPRVNAEHIFLGLILEGSGVAAQVLKKLGIQPKKAREEILRQTRAAS